MFRPEDVRKQLDKRPFQPFRICMSDGTEYRVTHPELCLVERTAVIVGVPDPELSGIVESHYCALVHITRFTPVNGKNGSTRKKKRKR